MAASGLTEAEFRAFVAEIEAFARHLTAKERSFLTSILVRATVAMSVELPGNGDSPDTALQANLAYALWQATTTPGQAFIRNPQPVSERIASDERR